MKQTDLILGIISLLMMIVGLGLFIVTRLISRYYKNHPVTMLVTERETTPSATALEEETFAGEEPFAAAESFATDPAVFEPLASPEAAIHEIADVPPVSAMQRFVATPVEHTPDAIAHEIRRVDVVMKF